MASVSLSAVDKFFPAARGDRVQVLFGISLDVEAGQFVVLLGPSGCGKSTTLRLIAGLERADAGEIRIGGVLANDLPPTRRQLAMVFQSYALFPHLSVAENIQFGLKARRVDKAERLGRLERVAEQLELQPFLRRKPAQLSGGQRQRVALGRALVSGASLILMDEPLSNLDAKLRQQMRVELRNLQRRLGLTVIYVTHDQTEAMTMADRVVVMRDGHVDQIDDPRTLYQHPLRAEVARFIGSPPMSLVRAERRIDGLVINGSGQIIGLPAHAEPDSSLCWVGVRPEDVRVFGADEHVNDSETDPFHHLEARLETVELLGADQLARFDVGADEQLIARVPVAQMLEEGMLYDVGFRVADMHMFNAENGRRIEVNHSADSMITARETLPPI